MTDDGWLHFRAKMMASRHALATMHATAREPADADALSDRESLGVRSDGRDTTDDLMAENRGVLRVTPLIVQDGEVGVTHAAVFDSDFNVLGSERSQINGFERHRLFRRLRNPRRIRLTTGSGCSGHWCSFSGEQIFIRALLINDRRADLAERLVSRACTSRTTERADQFALLVHTSTKLDLVQPSRQRKYPGCLLVELTPTR